MTSFDELPLEIRSYIFELTGNPVKNTLISKEIEMLVDNQARLCFDTLASSQDDVPALKSAIAQIPKDSSISSLERIKQLYKVLKNAGYNDSSRFASLQPEQIKNAYKELQEKRDEALLTILPRIATAASLNDPGRISAEDARKWLEDNSSSISSIQELKLDQCKIKVLPPEIGQLTGLITLHADNNQLIALPQEIGLLSNLQNFHLRNNNLIAITSEIGLLNKLEKLDVSRNVLTTLPKELGNCKSLKKLDISNNPLTTVPKEIRNCLALKCINVTGIRRSILPPLPERIIFDWNTVIPE